MYSDLVIPIKDKSVSLVHIFVKKKSSLLQRVLMVNQINMLTGPIIAYNDGMTVWLD